MVLIPGTVQIRSRNVRYGPSASSIASVYRSITACKWSASASSCSIRKVCTWLSRPVNASTSSACLARNLPLASSANAYGSRCPATIAFSIARAETPLMSETTEDSLIPASSRTSCKRVKTLARNPSSAVRSRVRSRKSRTGGGGTNEDRTNPCAPSSASHRESETSLLRPGRLRI